MKISDEMARAACAAFDRHLAKCVAKGAASYRAEDAWKAAIEAVAPMILEEAAEESGYRSTQFETGYRAATKYAPWTNSWPTGSHKQHPGDSSMVFSASDELSRAPPWEPAMSDDLLDLIEGAISNAHDLDVTNRDYAKAVLAALEAEYDLQPKDAGHG